MKKIISIISIFIVCNICTAQTKFITLQTKDQRIEVIVVGYDKNTDVLTVGRNGETYCISSDMFKYNSQSWKEILKSYKQNDSNKVFEFGSKINEKSTNKSIEEKEHDSIILGILEKETFTKLNKTTDND